MNRDESSTNLIRKHLRVLRDQHGGSLDAACVHCGLCCFAHVPVEGGRPILIRSLRCKFLAVDAGGQSRCTVYADRHEKAPWCKNLEEAITEEIFPQACPYVERYGGYQGPQQLDEEGYREAEARLRAAWRDRPPEPFADPDEWQAFMNGGAR